MSRNSRNPISWVPTVYFAMGLPFVVLNMVSVLMFKGLGIDDAQIALWTSLIMLPWTLKFLWLSFLIRHPLPESGCCLSVILNILLSLTSLFGLFVLKA